MGFFDFLSKDKPADKDSTDIKKAMGENNRILAELQNLVTNMTKGDPAVDASNNDEAWLERLRKEGSGL